MLLEQIEEKRDAIRSIGNKAAECGLKINLTPNTADQDYDWQRRNGCRHHDGDEGLLRNLQARLHAAE